MTRKRAAAAAALLLCLAALPSTAVAVSAASPAAAPAFSLTVSPAKLVLSPGQRQQRQAFTVSNTGSEPRVLDVGKGLFTPGDNGQAVPSSGQDPAQAWVTVGPQHFALQPGQVQVVTVSVDVPADAEPGERQIALIFSSRSVDRQNGGNIVVNGQIAVDLFLAAGRTDQVVHRDSVGPVTVPFLTDGPLDVAVTVRDDGTVHRDYIQDGALKAEVDGRTLTFPDVTVLRQSSRVLTTRWESPPAFCICTVRVTSDDGNGHPVVAEARVILFPWRLVLGLLLAAVGMRLLWGRVRPLLHRLTAPGGAAPPEESAPAPPETPPPAVGDAGRAGAEPPV